MKTEHENHTVLNAITEYVGTRELRPQSSLRYRSLERALPPAFLLRPIKDVVERDARQALESLAAHPGSYNKALSLLSAAFTLAVRNRLIDANPCQYIARKRVAKPQIEPLSFDEMRAVAAACDPAWVGRYVIVRALTGVRSREATALRWQDVDFAAGVIHVHATALPDGSIQPCPKTEGSTRTVPMIGLVREALIEQREPTGARSLIFGNAHDRPVALATISLAWRKALAACGLSYRRPYILRHSFVSLCLQNGIGLQDTAKLLGHVGIGQLVATYAALGRAPVSLAHLEAL